MASITILDPATVGRKADRIRAVLVRAAVELAEILADGVSPDVEVSTVRLPADLPDDEKGRAAFNRAC
jgi:hypothetical protein